MFAINNIVSQLRGAETMCRHGGTRITP